MPQYLKGAAAAIIVVDVSREETLSSVARHAELFAKHDPGGLVVVSCNKTDLLERSRHAAVKRLVASTSRVDEPRIFLTSAKDASGVESMFETVASDLVGRLRGD